MPRIIATPRTQISPTVPLGTSCAVLVDDLVFVAGCRYAQRSALGLRVPVRAAATRCANCMSRSFPVASTRNDGSAARALGRQQHLLVALAQSSTDRWRRNRDDWPAPVQHEGNPLHRWPVRIQAGASTSPASNRCSVRMVTPDLHRAEQAEYQPADPEERHRDVDPVAAASIRAGWR